MESFLTVVLVFFCLLLIAHKSENFFYISLAESLFPVRFYSYLFGMPVMILLPVILLATHMEEFQFRKLPRGIILIAILAFYTFFSHYSYFHTFSFSWLNNLFWLIVMYNMTPAENIEKIMQKSFQILRVMGYLLALMLYIAVFSGDIRLFGNPRQVAFYEVICIAAFLAEQKMIIPFFSKHMLVLLFFSGSVISSGGRLPMALLAVLGGICILFSSLSSVKKTVLCLLTSLLAFLFVQTTYFHDLLFRDHRDGSFSTDLFSDGAFTSGRSALYECAWNQFVDHPIFGYGYFSFKSPENTYNIFWRPEESLSCHSTWLQYLAELGVVGTSLYLIILLRLVSCGVSLLRSSDANPLMSKSGYFIMMVGIIFILGGTIDNHGFHYRSLFVVYLLAILMNEYQANRRSITNADTATIC